MSLGRRPIVCILSVVKTGEIKVEDSRACEPGASGNQPQRKPIVPDVEYVRIGRVKSRWWSIVGSRGESEEVSESSPVGFVCE